MKKAIVIALICIVAMASVFAAGFSASAVVAPVTLLQDDLMVEEGCYMPNFMLEADYKFDFGLTVGLSLDAAPLAYFDSDDFEMIDFVHSAIVTVGYSHDFAGRFNASAKLGAGALESMNFATCYAAFYGQARVSFRITEKMSAGLGYYALFALAYDMSPMFLNVLNAPVVSFTVEF